MGWTYSHRWNTTKEAIEDESRPSAAWEIVWKGGASVIYRNKTDGRIAHTHFLTDRSKTGGIGIKDIGDFRSVAAARKFLALTAGMAERYASERKEAQALVDHAASLKCLDGLNKGDRVYVKENYSFNGWATFRGWNCGVHRQMVLEFGGGVLCRCPKDAIDLGKTFGA